MIDRTALRLSGILLLVGILVSDVAELLHANGGDTLEETFANFAASGNWTAVHLGQFVGMALMLAGLLALFVALDLSKGAPRWLGFFSAISSGVALALAAVQFGVDGVANKMADVAWVGAPAADKAFRLATAQAVRWVEVGIASYHNMMLGIALVLLALAIVAAARVPRLIGYLMVVSGVAFIALGWIIGTTGFTSATTVPTYTGYAFLTVLTIWLLVLAWRRRPAAGTVPSAAAPARE